MGGIKIKVHIVYESEFCTDKPREYMAKPSIVLVTTDINEAQKILNKLREDYKNRDLNMCHWEDGFEYNNEDNTYGRVEIISELLR